MEQINGQIREGAEVLFDGPVYLARFDIAGVTSWCGLVVAPLEVFPPGRRDLQLHLADGRSTKITIAASSTSAGRLTKVHFEVVGDWNQSAD